MERVTFDSNGSSLVGHLYLPDDLTGPAPALPLLGPETFVKEQAPTQYARRLANDGFIALAFDPRYAGESGGEPRRWENPLAKVADVRAAVDYLASRSDVDNDRIAAMAVCQGSSAMLRAAADDPRIKALVTVAGHYRDPDGDVQWMGSAEHLDQRKAGGQAAKEKYERTGEVDYVPAIDPERGDVGMPGKFVWDWYEPWAERGIWDNRYAVMSDDDLLAYESASAAARLDKPYLMIHSDNTFLPDVARRQFDAVPAANKRLQWEGATQHFQYYDDPVVLDRTTSQITGFFRTALDLPLPASLRG